MADSDKPQHVRRMVFKSELQGSRRNPFVHASVSASQAETGALLTVEIVDASAPDSPGEARTFNQPTVTLGRSRDASKCDWTLEDPECHVSSTHARISVENGEATVTDLNSSNFTFLDDQQLEPDIPYPLSANSTIRIGGFLVRVAAGGTEPEPEALEAPTVIERPYENPFKDAAVELADVLARISEIYQAEAPERRDEALREAVDGRVAHLEQLRETLDRIRPRD